MYTRKEISGSTWTLKFPTNTVPGPVLLDMMAEVNAARNVGGPASGFWAEICIVDGEDALVIHLEEEL